MVLYLRDDEKGIRLLWLLFELLLLFTGAAGNDDWVDDGVAAHASLGSWESIDRALQEAAVPHAKKSRRGTMLP